MKTDFVRFYTKDSIELQGLLFSPQSSDSADCCIIHIHGLAGNFYENSFIDQLAKDLTSRGFSFFVFNNRGHDYISDLKKNVEGKFESIPGGGAYEIFSECIYDIDAAINFIKERGVQQICLQGHSSGSNKVVYYQYLKKLKDVKAIILLSPCDDIGIMQKILGDKFNEGLVLANELVQQDKHSEFIPKENTFYPMSAKTYLDYYGAGSLHDVFPYREPDSQFKEIASIECPVFVRFGNDGEYVDGNIDDTLSLFKEKAGKAKSVDMGIIDGASHSYTNREKELSSEIIKWLIQLQN